LLGISHLLPHLEGLELLIVRKGLTFIIEHDQIIGNITLLVLVSFHAFEQKLIFDLVHLVRVCVAFELLLEFKDTLLGLLLLLLFFGLLLYFSHFKDLESQLLV
jgi:hypothetical protein